MEKQNLLILDERQISWKLKRMAFEIWEHNSAEAEIFLVGIEKGGMAVANSLADILKKISSLTIHVVAIKMNKGEPSENLPDIAQNLDNKSVVLVDDVANSGKTLLFALKPILKYVPSRIMMAVLVDRKHKGFPIAPDIVGHTISTTLQEHILVEHEGNLIKAAYLR